MIFASVASCNRADNSAENNNTTASTGVIEIDSANITQYPIQIGYIPPIKIQQSVQVNGYIEIPPQNRATVYAHLGGFVKEVYVLEGSYVKKGQILADLQDPHYITLQMEYVQARSKLEYNEKEYNRQLELLDKNIGSKKDYQVAQADYRTAKALTNSLAAQINILGLDTAKIITGEIVNHIHLRAPIQGYIKFVNVNIGKYVTEQEPLFEVIDTRHLHIELKVYENDAYKIRKGQKILFTLQDNITSKYEAEVYLLGKIFDTQSRTMLIHAHISEKNTTHFLPGMYVSAQILVNNDERPVLSSDAIWEDMGKMYVFAYGNINSKIIFTKTEIQAQKINDTTYSISADDKILKQKIVLKGAYYLISEADRSAE
ncbi:MAG: efflux RND transporter periplasmic adaptor subunit [Cytophagales bacterium]|nr:efflux RND transporter periplasmic adaptor subunit [Cytophagales bacterium]